MAILFRQWPEVLIAARLGSPLIIGVGTDEHFVASDASPLAGYTDKIVYLADHELAVVTADGLRVIHRDQGRVNHSVHVVDFHAGNVAKGGFDHFMLKEIFEQPESVENAMRGRLDRDAATAKFGGFNLTPQQLRAVGRIITTGCGTSWHAGLVGEYQIEAFARLPVEVEYASELRYRNPPLDNHTLLFAITQSGETADTLAALREMQRKGCAALGICNVVGSTIAQETDGGFYLHAGPEIGVASTKAFTSQCTVLAMLALYFGRLRHLSFIDGPERSSTNSRNSPKKSGRRSSAMTPCGGSRRNTPTATTSSIWAGSSTFPRRLEGALKLKEISYIHAEGYPAAEMKHGPIALVDEHTPSVFLMPQGQVYDKVLSNLAGDQGPRRAGDRRGLPGRHGGGQPGRRHHRDPRRGRILAAGRHRDSAATAGLSHRRGSGLRRRQAAQPRQERDGGVDRRADIPVCRSDCWGGSCTATPVLTTASGAAVQLPPQRTRGAAEGGAATGRNARPPTGRNACPPTGRNARPPTGRNARPPTGRNACPPGAKKTGQR